MEHAPCVRLAALLGADTLDEHFHFNFDVVATSVTIDTQTKMSGPQSSGHPIHI